MQNIKPPSAGRGRPKGAVNKTTALLKDAILQAAELAGNKVGDKGIVSYLEQQAEENPGPFMSLLGKVLPMQVVGELTMTHNIAELTDEELAAIAVGRGEAPRG